MKRYSKPIHLSRPIAGPKRDSSLALINVVFLLLVFLLVSGTLRQPLPDDFDWAVTTSETGGGAVQGSLVVDQGGAIWRGGELLSRQEVEDHLARAAAGDRRVSVQVDKRAPMRAISELAAQSRAAGIIKMSLITVEAAGG